MFHLTAPIFYRHLNQLVFLNSRMKRSMENKKYRHILTDRKNNQRSNYNTVTQNNKTFPQEFTQKIFKILELYNRHIFRFLAHPSTPKSDNNSTSDCENARLLAPLITIIPYTQITTILGHINHRLKSTSTREISKIQPQNTVDFLDTRY